MTEEEFIKEMNLATNKIRGQDMLETHKLILKELTQTFILSTIVVGQLGKDKIEIPPQVIAIHKSIKDAYILLNEFVDFANKIEGYETYEEFVEAQSECH